MTKHKPPFLILKPKPGTYADTAIRKDSGIVGVLLPVKDANGKEIVIVSYEGNLYGSSNLVRYEDRVMHAADRLETGYPTVARSTLPFDQFMAVGVISKNKHGDWFTVDQHGTIRDINEEGFAR